MTIPTGSRPPVLGAGELLTHESLQLLPALRALLLALGLGALAAAVLRRRALHWSWAAVAALAALLLAPLLGGRGRIALVAGAVAAFRARRHHRDDLEAGADVGRAARARLTPVTAVRVLGARVARDGRTPVTAVRVLGARVPPDGRGQALTRRLAALRGGAGREETLLIGRDMSGRAVRVPFDRERPGHTLVVGATGSGKTVTQTLIAEHAIADARAVVVVDPKGDADMHARLAAAAARHGREFLEWTPGGPSSYNPYAHGGETEIADRLLAGERFTEPHYLRQAQRYLGHAIRTLRACRREVSLAAIVELLDPGALELLLRGAAEAQAGAGHAYLDSLTARQLRDLAGVRDRLAILAESEVGRWLGPVDGAPSIDLLAACRSAAVVCFRLEADSRPLMAQMLGAAIVQDLQSLVAALQSAPAPALVAIDEFSALGARQVTALFGRARSAGVSLLLGTQEVADLRLPGSERLLEQVMGNLSLLVAHRQVVPDSAELISRLAGTRGTWRVSWSSGRGTSRARSSEPMLDPESLMALAPGCGAVIGFGAAREVSVVRVRPERGER